MNLLSITVAIITVILNTLAACMIHDVIGIKPLWLKILLLIPPFGLIWAIILLLINFVDFYFLDKKEEETFREL